MDRRQIFLTILSHFTKQIDDFKYTRDEQLAERIKAYLEGGKYLIVLDDVWESDHFDYLKIAFPKNHKGSRVLVTTRNLQVAIHADSANPHRLKFLTDDEIETLLQKKVFRKDPCPAILVGIGKNIATKCRGLPLAVVVIAGVLNKESTVNKWKKVDGETFPLIFQENQTYKKVVELSYNKLDFYRQQCFLYLAAFPIGHEICAWKLIRLWIAEGFINPKALDLEGTAETYLKDIVNRNLLMVSKRRADGEIKTCRLHDIMHDFCKSEASNKNLFHEIDGAKIERNDGDRRLCIHSSLDSFINSEKKPSGEHVRSFLTSTKLKIPTKHLSTIPKSYPLLKVFDAENLNFEMLPKDFYLLYHLCYVAVSIDLKSLPKPFTELWNIQTLVFKTTHSTVDVQAEIWNMPKLRHILANASLEFPPPKKCEDKSSSSCAELQTLSTISPNSCREDIFNMTPKLLKLGVRGNLVELLESKGGICLFDNNQKLHKLENLKLIHNDQASILQSFPQANKFPRKLRKLTLSNTSFDWKDICILGSLHDLEVLKLDECAAMGNSWELINVVFKSLQFLRIGRTDLVYWTSEESSFPVLKWLYLSHCASLNALPLAFKDVKSLKVMDLLCPNKQAALSAPKIRDQQPREDGFVLTIYPPDL